MKGAFVIFICMVAVGIILYLTDLLYYRKKYPPLNENRSGNVNDDSVSNPSTSTPAESDNSICCGMHIVCEKTNLSPVSPEITYYDDEELDRFQGREDNEYSQEEIEEFREVLLTLLPQDVAGWSRSIQLRQITLPREIREELIMIVSDLRDTGNLQLT